MVTTEKTTTPCYTWSLRNVNDPENKDIPIYDFFDQEPKIITVYTYVILGHVSDGEDMILGTKAEDYWIQYNLPPHTLPFNQEYETNKLLSKKKEITTQTTPQNVHEIYYCPHETQIRRFAGRKENAKAGESEQRPLMIQKVEIGDRRLDYLDYDDQDLFTLTLEYSTLTTSIAMNS